MGPVVTPPAQPSAFVQGIISLKIRLCPQLYNGAMTEVWDSLAYTRDLTKRGFPDALVSPFYDAKHLPRGWMGSRSRRRGCLSDMEVGSLFSGIGGLDLGLARAGFRHAFFCESDAWRRSVLAQHWPGVPIYEDVSCREPCDQLGTDT